MEIREKANFEAAVHPRVITIMMELQEKYNLPIEIVCGDELQELRVVRLSTSGYDEDALRWFINTAVTIEELRCGCTFEEAEEL